MTQISPSDQYPQRLAGKVVVVTGAARGQGTAEVAALERVGATVVGTDVAPEGSGCRPLDISKEADWAKLAAELKETYGQVYGLVNNAGVIQRERIGSVRAEDFAQVQAVNTVGPLLGIQYLSPLMQAGGPS